MGMSAEIPGVGTEVDPDDLGGTAKALLVAQLVFVLFVIMLLVAWRIGSNTASSLGFGDADASFQISGRGVS